MKKILSIFLSIIMVVNMCCVNTMASFYDNTYTDTNAAATMYTYNSEVDLDNNLTIESQGTIGSMIEEEFEEYTETVDNSQGFAVQSIEMNDKVATVEFITNADCTLLVAVYDEAGESLIATGTSDVAMVDSIAEVTIDIDTMPQYFFLKAYLVDSETFAPYSLEYTCPLYTQSMQELQDMTTDDFEADRVVNFDESEETNFAVYSEDINVIGESVSENNLVTEDNENFIYVFENINEEISGLVSGDIFSYYTGEYDLIIKVASISIDGTTATITGAELELEDVFDYIKLDGETDTDEAEIDPTGMDENVTYEGLVEEDTVETVESGYGVDEIETVESITGEVTINSPTLKFKIDDKDGDESGIEANIGLKLSLKVKLYLTPSDIENFYIELKLQYELKSYVKVECDLSDYTKTLAQLAFSNIPLLNFVFRPDFVLKVEGSIEWNGTIKGTIFGLKISMAEGVELSCLDKPKVESELKAEASILIGLNIKPEVYLGVDLKFTKLKVVSGTLSVDFGVEISGSMEIYNISTSGESEKHTCSNCIDGDISLVAEASAQVQVLKKKSEKYKIASFKKKIMDWYFSFDSGGFGLGSCPNISYKTTFTVVDEKTGDVLPYVTVKCADESVTTDENGKCVLWLYPDKYEIQFALEGYNTTKKTVTVDDEKLERTIKLGYSKPISGYWPDTNVSYIVPPTRDGDLTWSLDANGHLSIWGHGNYETAAWRNYSASIFSAYIEVDDITSCKEMFSGCSSLQTIDLSKLDTSKVINMQEMFFDCISLQTIDLSKFDTSQVTNMCYMFGYSGVQELDLSMLNTSKVTDMSSMFQDCSSMRMLDLSNLNTLNVTDMQSMFFGCSSLQTLDLSNFNTSNVINMGSMFGGCSSLQTLDLSNLDTSKVTDMTGMFSDCSNMHILDLSKLDTSKVTCMQHMFSGCRNMQTLELSKLDTTNVTNMGYMFSLCSSLQTLDLSNLDTSNVTNMQSMFSSCSGLKMLDLSNLDTSNVTNMQNMFNGCEILENVNVSSFNTTNVTNMQGMFARCYGLKTIDLANYNTSNVTNMIAMFNGCSSLQTLDLSNFDTSQVTNMQQMFSLCSSLQTINLSNFNTSKVVCMEQMFSSCKILESVDLSDFDTPKVTSMNGMFSGCENLCILDLTSFDTSCVTSMSYMFMNCYNLHTIYLDVNPDAKQISMLYKCPATIIGTTSADTVSDAYDQPSATPTDATPYEEGVIEEVAEIAGEYPEFTEDEIPVNTTETTPITGIITTQSFTGLEPNTVYNFYDMKDMDVANPFATDNMLYVAQFTSDANGNLDIEYIQRLKCVGSDAFVVKMEHVETTPDGGDEPIGGDEQIGGDEPSGDDTPETIDISGATVTIPSLTETGSAINVNPTVKYNGNTLVKDVDYKLSGDCKVTAAGAYNIVITGIGDYSGTKTVSYTVAKKQEVEEPSEDKTNETTPVLANGWATLDNGDRVFYSNGVLVKNKWVTGTDGQLRYINNNGIMVRDEFVCDGTYTYYLQYDGSPMKDRLTYHPDGIHVIYFDSQGHEVFSDFANVRTTIEGNPVDDYCFFDVYGYLYVDVVTYDKEGKNLYYANPYGVLERNKWFQFSDTVMCADGTPWNGAAGNFGYANADGTLMVNTYTYDWEGRLCYMQGNGVALY